MLNGPGVNNITRYDSSNRKDVTDNTTMSMSKGLEGHLGETNIDLGQGDKEADLSRNTPTALTAKPPLLWKFNHKFHKGLN